LSFSLFPPIRKGERTIEKRRGREEEEGAEKGRKNRAAPLSKDVKIRSVFVVNIHFYLTSGRPYDKIITIGKNYND
jgi:hypothetical protein